MRSTLTIVSPNALLAACGVLAACCVLAAGGLLRHLWRVEARLRAVETADGRQQTPAAWVAGVERLASHLVPAAYRAALQRRLDRANLGSPLTPPQVLLLACAGGFVTSALTAIVGTARTAVLLFPGYVVLGILLAGFWLDRRATRRRQDVQHSLPATLDLLVLAMEAGLSLDAALREVVAEWQSPASRELERVVLLTQLGASRTDAIGDIAELLDLEMLRRLAARLGAAERLGSSVASILRAEAAEARRERRALATRRIAQAPTKILIPTALLILPVTLIVLLGPALPQVLRIVSG